MLHQVWGRISGYGRRDFLACIQGERALAGLNGDSQANIAEAQGVGVLRHEPRIEHPHPGLPGEGVNTHDVPALALTRGCAVPSPGGDHGAQRAIAFDTHFRGLIQARPVFAALVVNEVRSREVSGGDQWPAVERKRLEQVEPITADEELQRTGGDVDGPILPGHAQWLRDWSARDALAPFENANAAFRRKIGLEIQQQPPHRAIGMCAGEGYLQRNLLTGLT